MMKYFRLMLNLVVNVLVFCYAEFYINSHFKASFEDNLITKWKLHHICISCHEVMGIGGKLLQILNLSTRWSC